MMFASIPWGSEGRSRASFSSRKPGVGVPSGSTAVPGSGHEEVSTRETLGALATMIER
jgi:hypothetical protein